MTRHLTGTAPSPRFTLLYEAIRLEPCPPTPDFRFTSLKSNADRTMARSVRTAVNARYLTKVDLGTNINGPPLSCRHSGEMRPRPPMCALHQNQGAVHFSETKAPNEEAANPCVEQLVRVMQNSFDVDSSATDKPTIFV
jgi:hypothetical protein